MDCETVNRGALSTYLMIYFSAEKLSLFLENEGYDYSLEGNPGSLSRAMGDPHVHACTLPLAIMNVQRDLGKDYILFICFPTYITVSDKKTVIRKYLLSLS